MMLDYLTVMFLVPYTQLVNYTQLTMLIFPPRYCWKQLFHACSLPILLFFFLKKKNHTSFFTIVFPVIKPPVSPVVKIWHWSGTFVTVDEAALIY